jgi:hypothetical protein
MAGDHLQFGGGFDKNNANVVDVELFGETTGFPFAVANQPPTLTLVRGR